MVVGVLMASLTGPGSYVGYRPVKEELSGLHLPLPQKGQEIAELNLLQVVATLQPSASQQNSHPQCPSIPSFLPSFLSSSLPSSPILKIWSEFILTYSVVGHHQVDDATKKNKTHRSVGFTTAFRSFQMPES